MAEMKLKKPKFDAWTYNARKSEYYRTGTAVVLCNYDGHCGEDTLKRLIEKLQKIDASGIVTLDRDDDTGQMGVFVSFMESRGATDAEIVFETNKATKEALEEVRRSFAREKSKPAISDMMQRSKLAHKNRLRVITLKERYDIVESAREEVEDQVAMFQVGVGDQSLSDLEGEVRMLADEALRLRTLINELESPT